MNLFVVMKRGLRRTVTVSLVNTFVLTTSFLLSLPLSLKMIVNLDENGKQCWATEVRELQV